MPHLHQLKNSNLVIVSPGRHNIIWIPSSNTGSPSLFGMLTNLNYQSTPFAHCSMKLMNLHVAQTHLLHEYGFMPLYILLYHKKRDWIFWILFPLYYYFLSLKIDEKAWKISYFIRCLHHNSRMRKRNCFVVLKSIFLY